MRRKEPYYDERYKRHDEPHGRMGESLDGRRDVVLDGDQRPGGGFAGRPDYQAVQEIIMYSLPTHEMNC